jgi:methylated-DNA-protein-cysteine methyltransferase related protein
MAAPKKNAATKKPATKSKPPRKEKLPTVTPSGKREENFYELVLDVVRQIPKGRVTSYGAIAAALGAKSSSRMVGWALLGAKRIKHDVPAHRVVNRMGMLSGRHHFNPPSSMQKRLEKEGVKVTDDKVVDFKKLFWDPADALF